MGRGPEVPNDLTTPEDRSTRVSVKTSGQEPFAGLARF